MRNEFTNAVINFLLSRSPLVLGWLACCILGASGARAQTDLVGMYFDIGGTSDRYTTTTTPEILGGWVVLSNISDPNGITGVYMRGFSSNGPLNGVSMIGPMYFGDHGDWVFPAAPPLPWAETMPVVIFDLLVASPEHRVELFLAPLDLVDAVCYAPVTDPENGYVALNAANGDFSKPLAIINESAVVPTRDQAWGQVKALYR